MNSLLNLMNSYKKKYSYLTEPDINAILELVKIREYEKGDYLISFGEYNSNHFVLLEGLVKVYYWDENGDEVIVEFHEEKELFGAWHTSLQGKPSEFSIQVLEPSLIIVFNVVDIEALSNFNVNILKLYKDVLKEMLAQKLEEVWTRMNKKPEFQYQKLLEERPGLLERVHQKEIANYLGITPVSLSRIKKRLSV